MLLDFTEIPPAKSPSQDTEAFEKFAKQFFEEMEGGRVIKSAGRGADGGVDLIVDIDEVRWLVSCKHYLSGKVVPSMREIDPHGRAKSHGCQGFLCFYSTTPANSLNTTLRGLVQHQEDFRVRVMNGRDIEAGLLSYQNARGWTLAARWFPRSYAKLFSQLVHPINHYSPADIAADDRSGTVASPRGGMHALYFSEEGKQRAMSGILFMANEAATSSAFSAIFLARIAELASIFPGTFVRARFSESDNIHDIFPSWDFATLAGYYLRDETTLRGIYTVCLAWSLWDQDLAREFMRAIELLHYLGEEEERVALITIEDVRAAYDAKRGDGEADRSRSTAYDMSLNSIAKLGSTLERGYFASLLCFCPGGLSKSPNKNAMTIRFARHFGELDTLQQRLLELTAKCDRDDRNYVHRYSTSLYECLVSLRLADSLSVDDWRIASGGLGCFSGDFVEPWQPDVEPNSAFTRILRPV
jgi:hypothetical protein